MQNDKRKVKHSATFSCMRTCELRDFIGICLSASYFNAGLLIYQECIRFSSLTVKNPCTYYFYVNWDAISIFNYLRKL